MISSINLFLFCSLLLLFFNPEHMRPLLLSSSSETRFELQSLPQSYLTFIGDSHLLPSAVALTKESMSTNPPRSAGVVFYRHPILFLDPHSRKVPSFYTMFAFSIQSIYGDEEAFGGGLAFLISPDDDFVGSPGYMGLVDSTDPTRNKFIAIEFDTKYDPIFQDPDDNHVGLNINSLFSVKLARSSSLGVNLKSGALISTWIFYKSKEKRLEVFLSASYLKPKKPTLKVDIDLSKYVKDKMYVGFSAAAEGNLQMTRIAKWEFTIMGLSPPPPPSLLDSGRTFSNPSESGRRHNHLSRFAMGLSVGVCSVPFIVLFGWFCWKKLMWITQKPEETSNQEMQYNALSEESSLRKILLYILVDEVANRLNIEKALDNEAELIHVKTPKSSISLCNSLPAVKPRILPLCSSLPSGGNDMTSV